MINRCKVCRKPAEKGKLCRSCFVNVGVKIAEMLGGYEQFRILFDKFNAIPKEEHQKFLDEAGMTDEKAYKQLRKLLKINEPS